MHSTLASKDQQAQAEKKMTEDVVIAESVPSTTTVKMHTLENQASQKIDVKEKAVDFRYVPHGDGPCSCCGPWSE